MSVAADQVRAEERAAREQHRRMQRLAMAAARERAAAAARDRRARRRELRLELAEAERAAAAAAREYGKALTAYGRCSDAREPELGRALDRAYAVSMAAGARVRGLREELGAL